MASRNIVIKKTIYVVLHQLCSSLWTSCVFVLISQFEVVRGTGSVLRRTALWDCIGDTIALFIGCYEVAWKLNQTSSSNAGNSPTVQFETTSTQSLAQFSRSEIVRLSVWKEIPKNTPLSSKIHCYFKNRNSLYLNR